MVHDGCPDAPTQHVGNLTYFLPILPNGLLLQCLLSFSASTCFPLPSSQLTISAPVPAEESPLVEAAVLELHISEL